MNPQIKSKLKSALFALCFWLKKDSDFLVPLPGYNYALALKHIRELDTESQFRLHKVLRFLEEYRIAFDKFQGSCAFIGHMCILVGMPAQEEYMVACLYRLIANPCTDSYGFADIPRTIFKKHSQRIRGLRIQYFVSEGRKLLQEAERKSK